MPLAPGDLFCDSCGSYVHPFLDACPACGARMHGRYADVARGDDLGLARLLRHPIVVDRVSALTRTFALQTARGVGALSAALEADEDEEEADLVGLLNYFAIRARYRAWLTPSAPPSDDLRLHVEADRLVLHRARPTDTVLDVDLHAIRSIGRPIPNEGSSTRTWIRGVELTGTHAGEAGPVTIHLGNPSGFFSTKARPDHFAGLGWAIGILAGMAAERRWREIGARAHAREIGEALGSGPQPTGYRDGVGGTRRPVPAGGAAPTADSGASDPGRPPVAGVEGEAPAAPL